MAAAGWIARAPLIESMIDAHTVSEWAQKEIGWRQRLYRLGFPHGNCGGRCVKQGQAGWRLLLKTFPERFAEVEQAEKDMQDMLGKDVTILREQVNGTRRALPLAELRSRETWPLYDYGGCSCFAGDE